MKIILAFEDAELTPQEKQSILLSNLYGIVPDNIQTAFAKASWFLNGGKENEEETSEALSRVYSCSKDANFIFSAFRQTHNVDLETVQMHWWKFFALFMDLGQDTTFCQLIGLRKRIKNGTATKEEKKAAREMGSIFEIPETDDRTLEEKEQEAEFLRLVKGNAK